MPNLLALALCCGLVGGVGLFLFINFRQVHSVRAVNSRSFSVPAIRLFLIAVLFGLVAGFVTFVVSGIIGVGIAVFFAGAMVMHWVRKQRSLRVSRALEECYPDLIERLISQVRSGVSLVEALARAAAIAPTQVAQAAEVFWRSVHISGDASACLDDLKKAWASPTGDILVETVRVAHEVGGTRVIEVLRELADQVRRERNLRREVEAKQSWVKVAARVGVAAPWVVLLMLSFRSEAALAYNSPAGIILIVCGLALSVVAYQLMVALGRTPVAPRVFAS